jgi:hypothetical protein
MPYESRLHADEHSEAREQKGKSPLATAREGAESGLVSGRFLLPSLDMGLNQNPCRPRWVPQFSQTFDLCTGSQFWTLTPSSPLCLLLSVSSNDLMDQTYIKAATRLRDEMASPSSPSPILFRGTSDPISTVPPWQSCVPVTRRARQHRKANRSRSFSADSTNALS